MYMHRFLCMPLHGYGRVTLGVFVALLLLSLPLSLWAQTTPPETPEQQAKLEAELANINQEIAGLNTTITDLKGEGVSLGRDINLLNANITKANLNIKAKNLQISRLGDGIADKARTVRSLAQRIEREKQSLAQLVRKTNEIDQASLPEMLLSGDDLSNFFLDLDSFDAIRGGLKNSADALKNAKAENIVAKKCARSPQRG